MSVNTSTTGMLLKIKCEKKNNKNRKLKNLINNLKYFHFIKQIKFIDRFVF